MAAVYENWERLVRATLRREDLRISALRTPSDLSSVSLSSASPSFNFGCMSGRVSSCNFRSLLVGDSFTYHQILSATDSLNDSNLIKHGHSGDLYYGVLESGIRVVVKKINLSSIDRKLHFMSELEIYGMVYHSRMIPFLGYCIENVHEKFLVYKYTPNKDLSSHLQRQIVLDADGNGAVPSLDWATRLKIATGAAEGLCYLHNECFPPLVHRDIQASSILLDDDFDVRLGSLTEVCIHEKDDKNRSIARFLRLPKFQQSTSGTSNASCTYDVYCFGKVLLELVSGKLGISSVNDSTMKDWMANTLRYIVPDDKKLVLNFVDPSLLIEEHLLTEVWLVTLVAKVCLSSKPSKRPEMGEICKALEYIKSARFSAHGNVHQADHPNSVSTAPPMTKISEGSKLMGWILRLTTNNTSLGSSTSSGDDGFSDAIGCEYLSDGKILASPGLRNFTYSELQHATENFGIDSLLGEGESGRLYKGLVNEKPESKSGSMSLVAIKEFYYKMRTSEELQLLANLLGKVSHPNLVKLLGCCLENKHQFFVYEFMQKGSLDCHLFQGGSAYQPLSWDIRLKILIGAARGLGFLHALQEQGFFHQISNRDGFNGCFNPSRIILDGDYNAKIMNFYPGEFDLPNSDCEAYPLIVASGKYANVARKWDLTRRFRLKSDAVGFGFLLIQMLAGGRVYHPNYSRINELLYLRKSITTKGGLEKMMDPRLKGKYPSEPAKKVAKLAILCLDGTPEDRPSMKEVVMALEKIEYADKIPKQPLMNLSG